MEEGEAQNSRLHILLHMFILHRNYDQILGATFYQYLFPVIDICLRGR
jgi:hypothetical protein